MTSTRSLSDSDLCKDTGAPASRAFYPTRLHRSSWKNRPMNSMMYTGHWMLLGAECDLIQAEVYKNTHLHGVKGMTRSSIMTAPIITLRSSRKTAVEKYGKSKEHRPNPIIQMGLFMDGDGIPLAFSLFPGNANEQIIPQAAGKESPWGFRMPRSLFTAVTPDWVRNPSENTIAVGEARAYIVTQSIQKAEERTKKSRGAEPAGL